MHNSGLKRKTLLLKFFIALLALMLLPTGLMILLRLDNEEVVLVKEIQALTKEDIVEFEDTLIVPTIYHNIFALDSLEGKELKDTFVEIMLPAVLIAKHRVSNKKEKLKKLQRKYKWNEEDSVFYQSLLEEYKAGDVENLLQKLKTPPNSIILAQAAVESGWGRSRFCKEANNIFGIWSYNEDEPRIIAKVNRGNNPIYLRKYNDFSSSIEDYFRVISKAKAYHSFRQNNLDGNSPYELVEHLVYYSERRWDYVNQLKTIMRQNDFHEFDRYKIHPDYLSVKRTIK